MTVERYKRCTNCGIEHLYQASGYPAGRTRSSSADLCHGCYGAMKDALRLRPRLFEGRWQDTKDIPALAEIHIDQVLAWERQNDLDMAKSKALPIKQIFSGLFQFAKDRVTLEDSQQVRAVFGREKFAGVKFKVATWQKKPEYEIRVEMEYDLQKQCFTGLVWPHGVLPRKLV